MWASRMDWVLVEVREVKKLSQFSLGDKILHFEVEVVPGQCGRLAWTECYSGVEGG